MIRNACVAVAAVILAASFAPALAQQRIDPTPDHIYYYGPVTEQGAQPQPRARANRQQTGQRQQPASRQPEAPPSTARTD